MNFPRLGNPPGEHPIWAVEELECPSPPPQLGAAAVPPSTPPPIAMHLTSQVQPRSARQELWATVAAGSSRSRQRSAPLPTAPPRQDLGLLSLPPCSPRSIYSVLTAAFLGFLFPFPPAASSPWAFSDSFWPPDYSNTHRRGKPKRDCWETFKREYRDGESESE